MKPVFAALLVLSTVAAKAPEPKLALNGLDPVALSGGAEARGREDLVFVHGRFTYRFAAEASRTAFAAEPDRFAIRFGGACGKMGPLSGDGSPERFHVQDGRIYVFASETCRDRFKADPASFIDTPDPVPAPTAEEARRGRELLDSAAQGFGGAKAVDALRTLETRTRALYPARDTTHEALRVQVLELPGHVRYEERWGPKTYGHGLGPAGAFVIADQEEWAAEPDVQGVIARRFAREPLVLVARRAQRDLVARALAPGTLDGKPVERVEVALLGATSVLTLDPATGHVLAIGYRDRTPQGIRPIERRFSDFRPVAGLVLPHGEREWHEGRERPSPRLELTTAVANAPVGRDPFVVDAPQP